MRRDREVKRNLGAEVVELVLWAVQWAVLIGGTAWIFSAIN